MARKKKYTDPSMARWCDTSLPAPYRKPMRRLNVMTVAECVARLVQEEKAEAMAKEEGMIVKMVRVLDKKYGIEGAI